MKIFWSDREGNPAPPEAQFFCYPFSAGPILSTQTQIKTLPPPAPLNIARQTFLPEKKEWIQIVNKALRLIDEGILQKVVLARTCILELNSSPDPFALAALLRERAQNAHVFALQLENEAFVGASPERLFQRNGSHIISEAIAGTRRRSDDPIEDERLKKELLASPKDLHEFSLVKEYIGAILSPHASHLSFTPTSIHQTKNVQHLYSKCTATLIDPSSEAKVISLLHPTPALAGAPKEKALAAIETLEPFERGLYGGAIGWTTRDASDWVVSIRSCRIKKNIVTLYSGVGIVKGSDPEAEWDELNQKIRLFINC